jgi:hypothetical protein
MKNLSPPRNKAILHVGDRVEDEVTHERGSVVHVYSRREMRDSIVAVKFDGRADAFAIPADALRRVKGKSGG